MDEKDSSKFALPDKAYNVLKWLAVVAIDALGVAYLGLAAIWQLPYGDEVARTCIIISTLIGVLIGVSSANYYTNKAESRQKFAKKFKSKERMD